MNHHQFIFSPGEWIGQGKLSFSTSPTQLRFYTKWVFSATENGFLRAEQWIEQQGESDLLNNSFLFSDITPKAFAITLSNELLGSVSGTGIISNTTVAWEFKQPANEEREDAFEGFEVYELQDNGDYLFHAEYCSGEQFRTIVEGRIWKKSSQ